MLVDMNVMRNLADLVTKLILVVKKSPRNGKKKKKNFDPINIVFKDIVRTFWCIR